MDKILFQDIAFESIKDKAALTVGDVKVSSSLRWVFDEYGRLSLSLRKHAHATHCDFSRL